MNLSLGYNKNLIIIVVLVGFIFSNISAQNYGLKFNGYRVANHERTELNLTQDDFFRFQDEFEIAFSCKIPPIKSDSKDALFGYVFRIFNERNENIDLLIFPYPEAGLRLVVGKTNTITDIPYLDKYIDQWIELKVKFMLAEDNLVIQTPDTSFFLASIGFKKEEAYKIIFGANRYKQFTNVNVPEMSIKDIKVSENGKLKYYWPLNEEEGDNATDRIKGVQANVVNPLWLVNNYQKWNVNFQDNIPGYLLIAADTNGEKIFMLGKDSLYVYSSRSNNIQTIAYQNQPQFIDRYYRAEYNDLDKKIYCYIIDNQLFYALDTETGTWDKTIGKKNAETDYHFHNSYFSSSDSSIYLFGGYGHYRYKNSIWKIDLSENTWNKLPTNDSVFLPRHLAGLGALNDTVYILGGQGNPIGNQLAGPRSYFDMIAYSVKNGSFIRKYEIPHLIEDMALGNNIPIIEKSRDYYALIYSLYSSDLDLYLIKGNLDFPDVQMVGEKVPIKIRGDWFESYLFYMPAQNKLYVAYTYFLSDSISYVNISSINYPPNNSETKFSNLPRTHNTLIYFILLAFIVIGTIVWFYFKQRQKLYSISKLSEETNSESNHKIMAVNEPTTMQINYNILLFGGFQVFERNNKDITSKFSPLLKELFLLIFLHTFNNKGISSEKIIEILWYDKPEKSARNNMAVNMLKLRNILDEVGTFDLSSKTGYWKLLFNNAHIKCDYSDFRDMTSSKVNLTKQKVKHLLDITHVGNFLSNVNYNWLDDFKASVSDEIIDTLVLFAKSINIKAEADFVVLIADSIFNFDIINEDAMIMKCKAQYFMGKHSNAKVTYDSFFKEFSLMYGQEYNRAFLDILKE